jgi:predicted Zn finger-like uncharacterized protein
MIVTCPACATRYSVDPSAISAEGRKVRCTRCSHVWHQMPPADMPMRVDLLSEPLEPDDRPETVVVPPPVKTRERRSSGGGWAVLIILLLLIAAVAVVGYVGRERVVQQWPELAPLYERIGVPVVVLGDGLELGEPTHVRRDQDGVALIEIEGEIKNGTEAPIDVPNLMVVLRNDASQSVAEYIYPAPQPSLASGQTLVYRMTIENPPGEAQRAAITFTDRAVTP